MAFAAYAVYAWADAIIKGLGDTLGIFEIGFFSTIFSILPGLFFARPREERWRDVFRLRHPRLIQLIAVLRVAAAVLVTYSFVTIPLAEAYCLVFLIPVFLTLLSVFVLREKVTIERWILVLVSFAGVLLVVKPGFRELELGHLTAIGCALASAVATTCTRFISGSERRTSLFLLPTLYTLLFNGAMLLAGFSLPSATDWLFLVLAGLLGGLGYVLQIAAITHAPASRVAPIQYSQIVWALILGALASTASGGAWGGRPASPPSSPRAHGRGSADAGPNTAPGAIPPPTTPLEYPARRKPRAPSGPPRSPRRPCRRPVRRPGPCPVGLRHPARPALRSPA